MSDPSLEIRHLRLVRALADEGGPTRAAARLHLTQSAVSHQLGELEARLGVALFARVRRKLVPTAAGSRLIEESRVLLAELARVENDLYRAGERKRETVRIVVECATSYYWLPAVTRALAREAPHVDLRIALAATREPIAALLRGTVDLAIVSSPVRERTLVATPLFADRWMVIMPPGHPLAPRAWIGGNDLARETVFANEATRSDVARLRDLISAERARMPRIVTVPLTDALVAFVRDGLGLGLVSGWAVAPYVASGDVAACRFTRKRLTEQWVAATRRDAGDDLVRCVRLVREHASPAS